MNNLSYQYFSFCAVWVDDFNCPLIEVGEVQFVLYWVNNQAEYPGSWKMKDKAGGSIFDRVAHTHMHTYAYTRTYTHIAHHTYTHARTHTRTQIHTHTFTQTYTHKIVQYIKISRIMAHGSHVTFAIFLSSEYTSGLYAWQIGTIVIPKMTWSTHD